MIPKIYQPIEFDIQLPSIESYTTQNGIKVYKLPTDTTTAVQIEWVFEAGIWHDDFPGVAQCVGRLLKSGTQKHSEVEINEKLEFLGASLRISVNNDYTHISLMTLNKHLPLLLPIAKEIITQANFSKEELQIFITNAIQALEVNLKKCDFVANRLIEEQLFGIEHPYGRYLVREDYENLSREKICEFHRHYFRFDNCKVFIAGGIGQEEEKIFIQLFGEDRWNESSSIFSTKNHIIRPSSEKLIRAQIDQESQGVQAAIRMARHTIHSEHSDFLALQFLNVIFGGYFGSRLMSNIREDKGYTYGIYSYLANNVHNSFLIISSEVDSQFADATIFEIRNEMQRLRDEIISEDELAIAKNYVMGSLISDMEGVFSLIQMWKSLILKGNDEDYFYQKLDTFKNLGSDKLLELAQNYLDADDFYTTIVQ